MRTTEVEIVAVRIAAVDAEVPICSIPVYRAIEVGCIAEQLILPVEEDVTQVEITVCPVNTIEVVIAVDTHQVVEVHLVCCLVLLLGEVQLVSHLVGEEQSLLACLLVAHCAC